MQDLLANNKAFSRYLSKVFSFYVINSVVNAFTENVLLIVVDEATDVVVVVEVSSVKLSANLLNTYKKYF